MIFPRGYRSASLPFWTVEIPAGTRPLYRVRAHMKDPSEVKNVADIWARPDGGSAGRVNRKGQRVLYLALATAHLAMVEAKANPGDYVAVSQFIATEPLILVNIRDMDSPVGLTIKQERKLKAMRDLFNWIFNYSGHDPDNPRYEAAQVVALDYRLVIPPAVGWGYHSALVDSPWAFNVAIDADRAKNLLRLVNTQVFYYEGDPNPRLIRHSSLIPAKKNVEPSTPLIPSLPTKFFWNPPPR
ncbi:RES domain-containing protein [Kocuria sp. CPCC 205231]